MTAIGAGSPRQPAWGGRKNHVYHELFKSSPVCVYPPKFCFAKFRRVNPLLSRHKQCSNGSVLQIPPDRDKARDNADAHAKRKLVEEKPCQICVKIREKVKSRNERFEVGGRKIHDRRHKRQTKNGGKESREHPLDHRRPPHETV